MRTFLLPLLLIFGCSDGGGRPPLDGRPEGGAPNEAGPLAERGLVDGSPSPDGGPELRALVCKALGFDAIQAVPVSDTKDQQILSAFYGHTKKLTTSITDAYCATQAAAEPESYTWVIVPQVSMALTSYRLTADTTYLDLFITLFESMRKALTKGPDGYLGWYGKPLPLFRNPSTPDAKLDVMITSFSVVGMVAEFVQLVQCDPKLQAKYGGKLPEYLDLLENHLVKKWIARGNLVDLKETGAIFRSEKGLAVDKAHLTQPHNKHKIIIAGLVKLHMATGKDEYLRLAVRLGARYKRSLGLSAEHYLWDYWDPAGAWDLHPAQTDAWKHWIGPEHTGGYYASTLSQVVILQELGLIFTKQDLDRFLKTQLQVVWNGDVQNPVWHKVDGSAPGSGEYMCPALAPFDAKIESYVYGPAAQAARLASASHSWQGGPVARGWLEGKYLTLPRARGGVAIYSAVGDRFKAGAQNQALLTQLAYTVSGAGYKPPAKPSLWPNMPPEPP